MILCFTLSNAILLSSHLPQFWGNQPWNGFPAQSSFNWYNTHDLDISVCVCVWERERERERLCVHSVCSVLEVVFAFAFFGFLRPQKSAHNVSKALVRLRARESVCLREKVCVWETEREDTVQSTLTYKRYALLNRPLCLSLSLTHTHTRTHKHTLSLPFTNVQYRWAYKICLHLCKTVQTIMLAEFIKKMKMKPHNKKLLLFYFYR